MPVKGFFSWFKGLETSFFEATLKMSLLWFDELVMQSPTEDLIKKFPEILTELGATPYAANELSSVIFPIQKFNPDYKFGEPEIWQLDKYMSDATEKALTQFFQEKHGPWPERWVLAREVALTGCGVLDALNMVSFLSKQSECYLIPTEFEHRVINEITRPFKPDSDFDFFKKVADIRLPNLSDCPWEAIVEFRYHPFLQNFRKTLQALHAETKAKNVENIQEAFQEIERKHIKELLSLVKPDTLDSTIKGIVTNLPLPIPLNPLGIVDAVETVLKDKKLASDYGWLYFLYELT